MSSKYNTSVIRELIHDVFSSEELFIWIYDIDDFCPVRSQLADGMPLGTMAQKLIEFADKNELLDLLLEKIREKYPVKYREHEPRLLKQTSTFSNVRTGLTNTAASPGTLSSNIYAPPAEQLRAPILPLLQSFRPTVNRLSAYTYRFDEAQAILKDLEQLNEAVETLLQACGAPGWKSTDIRLQIQNRLIHILAELYTLMTRHTRGLDNMKDKLHADHRDSVQASVAKLNQVLQKDVENIRDRLRNGCDQITRATSKPAEAALLEQCRQQVHETLADLNHLVSVVSEPTQQIQMDMYDGIKQYVNELARITGSDKEV